MKPIFFLLFAVLSFAARGDDVKDEVVARFASYYGPNQYDFSITQLQLNRSPDWNDNQNNPPLAVRSALAAGLGQLKDVASDWKKWELLEVRLRHIRKRKWVYLVTYLPPLPAEGLIGHQPKIEFVVLLDGTAIVPRIKPFPK